MIISIILLKEVYNSPKVKEPYQPGVVAGGGESIDDPVSYTHFGIESA